MIGPLRRRHRWLAPGAFGLAAIGLAIGVSARPDAFVNTGRAIDADQRVPDAIGGDLRRLDGEPRMSLLTSPTDGLFLVAEERIEAADVLAYLTREEHWDGDLPQDATLIGAVAPLGASRLTGVTDLGENQIILYGLGQKRVVRTISAADVIGRGD